MGDSVKRREMLLDELKDLSENVLLAESFLRREPDGDKSSERAVSDFECWLSQFSDASARLALLEMKERAKANDSAEGHDADTLIRAAFRANGFG